ncbi:MAG: 23S rRNA (pseudouridine(1915)-N(3))-methyltransferase RlmH [Patescibacteria group bacterium]
MYRLTVVAVGSLKESYWKDAISEYAKRLSAAAKARVIEVADVPFKSQGEAPAVMRAEAEAIKKKILDGAYVIAMDKGGKKPSSEEFAAWIAREGEGGREIVFVIGGPLGLDPKFVAGCHATLSLSSLTFTHGEARAVLFEQLYRATTILGGKTYHY